MAFNFFFYIQFVIKMRKSLPSILCMQGVFLGPSLTLSSDTSWHVDYFVLEDTNKQTVRSYQNKWFHKSTFSAETGPSETLLGRG